MRRLRIATILFVLLVGIQGAVVSAQQEAGDTRETAGRTPPSSAGAAVEPEAGSEAQYRPTPPPVGAPTSGSLWPGFTPYVDLVSDLRARNVGDLVTIRIIENVRAQQDAATDADRDTDISGGISALFGLQNYVPDDIELSQLLGATSETSFSGSGANSRTNSFSTTITATVVEVLPGGNLVIQASRMVKVNEEEERLTVRGVIRPYDVGPRNDVLSTAVANLELHYGGKGVIGSNLKPGFLFRLIRYIF